LIGVQAGELPQAFVDAMNDDFNTAEAVAILFETCRALNKQYDEKLAASFVAMSQMLNILNLEPDVWFQGDDVNATAVETLVLARDEAKKAKDYAKADAIRDELLAQGIVLEDSAEGTRWKKV